VGCRLGSDPTEKPLGGFGGIKRACCLLGHLVVCFAPLRPLLWRSGPYWGSLGAFFPKMPPGSVANVGAICYHQRKRAGGGEIDGAGWRHVHDYEEWRDWTCREDCSKYKREDGARAYSCGEVDHRTGPLVGAPRAVRACTGFDPRPRNSVCSLVYSRPEAMMARKRRISRYSHTMVTSRSQGVAYTKQLRKDRHHG
jgi:hypothetical protein